MLQLTQEELFDFDVAMPVLQKLESLDVRLLNRAVKMLREYLESGGAKADGEV